MLTFTKLIILLTCIDTYINFTFIIFLFLNNIFFPSVNSYIIVFFYFELTLNIYIFSATCSKWTLQILHWFLHTTLGYILMMVVMTYNAYFTIALIIGGALGYWIFGPTLIQLNMQRFYRKQALVKCDRDCKGKMQLY